ncbi:unnamed protein product [Urochloa humidicola]
MEEGSSRRTAEAVAALPDDELIIEILSRLPAKSLCRFSCVSRAWRRPHLRPGQPPQVRADSVRPLLLPPRRQPPSMGLRRLVRACASRDRYGSLLPEPHL